MVMCWKTLLGAFTLLNLLLEISSDSHFKRVDGAIELTFMNWKEVLHRHKKLLVYMHDSSCMTDHCKHSYHEFLMGIQAHLRECPSTYGSSRSSDKMLDFGVADITTLKNKTLAEKVGQLPAVVYFFREQIVPYIHELSRESIAHWIKHQAMRHRIYEWHDIDDLRKWIGKLNSFSHSWNCGSVSRLQRDH